MRTSNKPKYEGVQGRQQMEHPRPDTERGGDGDAGGDGMTSNQKALAAAQTIVDFCHQQKSCQNCIFRLFCADSWKCHIDAFDLKDVLSNISDNNKNHGWI